MEQREKENIAGGQEWGKVQRRRPGNDKLHFYAFSLHFTCASRHVTTTHLWTFIFSSVKWGTNIKSFLLKSSSSTFNWKRVFIELNKKVQVHSLQVWLNPGTYMMSVRPGTHLQVLCPLFLVSCPGSMWWQDNSKQLPTYILLGSSPGFTLIIFGHMLVYEAITLECGQGDRISSLARPELYLLSLEPWMEADLKPVDRLPRNSVSPEEMWCTVPWRRGNYVGQAKTTLL